MKSDEKTKKVNWQEIQDELADANGLAILVVDENSDSVSESNNNSMCRMLYSSEEFAPECEKYCGRAFEMASEKGEIAPYQCYAGLECRAVPIKKDGKTELVAIVGRTFTKAENYRTATERAIEGDWQKFPPPRFFENVLFSGSIKNLETTAKKVENLGDEKVNSLFDFTGKIEQKESLDNRETESTGQKKEKGFVEEIQDDEQIAAVSKKITRKNQEESEEIAVWRSLFGSLLNLTYQQACLAILDFISKRYSLGSLAWLERRENKFVTIFAGGNLTDKEFQISLAANDEQLRDAAREEISLELQERKPEAPANSQIISLFPIALGNEIQSALIVADEITDVSTKRHIAKFCQTIAPQLEILRLRAEVARNGWLERAVQKFNENLKTIDSADFWSSLTRVFAELMRAERSSLLLLDEKTNRLILKAATGAQADAIEKEFETIGDRVARQVLHSGEPIVVQNINKIGLQKAPADWNYKTDSFISYPIEIGSRKIGVLNVTDRAGSENYSDSDLELLRAIVPQIAVLIDRAGLKHKAGEFEQLSVTDPLTGLLNRRYLEERLAEEIKRSNRHGFPMSFMMIDVDDFKSYNDNFSHPEGDKALQLVGHCLKDTLRGADVAARYGGEEFSILLPQTNSQEAETIAERIREKVETTHFPNRQVTISIGIASCSQVICTPQEIIAAADKALYAAKREGRNNVQVYENLQIVRA